MEAKNKFNIPQDIILEDETHGLHETAVYSLGGVKLYVDFNYIQEEEQNEEVLELFPEFRKMYEVRIVSSDNNSDDAAIYVSNELNRYKTIEQSVQVHNANRSEEANVNKGSLWFLELLKDKTLTRTNASASEPEKSEKETQ
jgi:hypothetical protein